MNDDAVTEKIHVPSGELKDAVVISRSLILQGVEEEVEEDFPTQLLVGDPMFARAKALRLSYKNIYEIINLDLLPNLQVLRLDNNRIEKIENLSSLVNLKWLDLSYNCIKAVTFQPGELPNLQNLTLYSNEISSLRELILPRGSDILLLPSLEVLSIGWNKITRMKELAVLSHLTKLRSLNLFGNPLIDTEDEITEFQRTKLSNLILFNNKNVTK